MRNRVGLYIREASAPRRYLKTHTKNGYALIQGQPVPVVDGVYYLRYKLGEKTTWERLSSDYKLACFLRQKREAEILCGALAAPIAEPASEGTPTLEKAVAKYLANIAALKSGKTAEGYSFTMNQFKEACGGTTLLKDIRKQDLLNYVVYLKKQDLSDRTIANRVAEVVTFLRANEIREITFRHKFTEKIVKAYDADDLKLLFCAAMPEEWILFQFFLGTGAREQEVAHACWQDINFRDGIYTIRDHAEWDFVTKDHEEREIPLPTHLLEALKKRTQTSELIFPAARGGPDGHFLRILKDLALRAGVNPDECGLHKFRKSYATLQHENGVSARTIQKRLGHSSLETTLAYLEAADVRSVETRKAVDETFAAFA
jgi:integrase/recombinase XerD